MPARNLSAQKTNSQYQSLGGGHSLGDMREKGPVTRPHSEASAVWLPGHPASKVTLADWPGSLWKEGASGGPGR